MSDDQDIDRLKQEVNCYWIALIAIASLDWEDIGLAQQIATDALADGGEGDHMEVVFIGEPIEMDAKIIPFPVKDDDGP